MEPWLITLIVVGVIIVLIVAFLIGTYNSLVALKNRVEEAWSDITVQLKRRTDLIPNLVNTVKGYAAHEKEVLEKVTQARSMVQSAQSIEQRQQAENYLTNTLRSLFAVAEAYPQLKANDNFIDLQRQLSELEEKIAFARQFYNDTTMKYNTTIQSFPTNLLAGMFGFQALPFFEVDDVQRQAVQVKF